MEGVCAVCAVQILIYALSASPSLANDDYRGMKLVVVVTVYGIHKS